MSGPRRSLPSTPPSPPRLLDSDAELAPLLRAANRAYAAGLYQPRAFAALKRRREQRARRRVQTWAAAVGVASFAAIVAARWLRSEAAPDLTLAAAHVDLLAPRVPALGARRAEALETPAPAPPSAERERVDAERIPSKRPPALPRRRAELGAPHEVERPEPAEPPARAAPAPERPPDCLEPARQGRREVAERCFVDAAAGQGLSAEMALLELARLRMDVWGDVAGAEQALRDHRQRFPQGSLSTEARLALVTALVQLGRAQEALDQSDALIADGQARDRLEQLRLLRGDLYQRKFGDCQRAIVEYAAISRASTARGDEAAFQRAVCLERLGRTDDAAFAYQEYLARTAPRRADEAQARLSRLSP